MNILKMVIFLTRRCDIVKYLTAEEIRRKYQNNKVILYAFEEQQKRIEEYAARGETKCPVIQLVHYFIDKEGNIFLDGEENGFKWEEVQRQDTEGAILAHFKALGFKKVKVGQCPYLSWEGI